MSLDNAIYALSNFNAIMGSTLGYANARNYGIGPGEALMDFGFNIMNGALRNNAAKEIHDHTGSYLGYAVNSAAGYGNPVSNYQGTMGLIGASMLSSPFGIFGFGYNPFLTSNIYGCTPFGGSYFSGCHNHFMFGGPTFFGPRGFVC